MTRYPFLESKGGKCIFGAFLFAMLLLARDTLITSCLVGFNKSQLIGAGFVLLLGFGFLVSNRKNIRDILTDQRMIWILILTAAILLPMIFKQDWQMMYFSILFCPLVAILFSYFLSLKETARWYVSILSVLSVYSILATYPLKNLAFLGYLPVPVFYNSNDWSFYNFGLGYAVTWEHWVRNFGIFREPGVYQFFILIALYLNNYTVGWEKTWKTWLINGILVLTMITTFAIGGYIELFLFVIFFYFDQKWYQNKWGRSFGIAVLALGAIVVTYLTLRIREYGAEGTFSGMAYDMWVRLTSGSDSLVDRLDAIFTNMRFVFRNPLLGDEIAAVLHGTNHNTSSTLILYAILGIFGGTLNVASWFALVWEKKRNLVGNLMLLLILFMSFNTQNLTADVFFWLFPTMALVERGLLLIQKE